MSVMYQGFSVVGNVVAPLDRIEGAEEVGIL